MKTRKLVILSILLAVLVAMATSCQVVSPETELEPPKDVTKNLPVIGSTSNDGSASRINVVPTAPAKVVTLSIPTVLPSGPRLIDETLQGSDHSHGSNQTRWTLERVFQNLTFENLTNLVQINDDTGGFKVLDGASTVGGGFVSGWVCSESQSRYALTVTGPQATVVQIRFQRIVNQFSCSS